MGSFKTNLLGIDWTFTTHSNDVSLDFEAVLWLFITTLDKHGSIKKLTKIEEKDKLKP